MAMKMADLAETCRHECKTNKLDPGVTGDGAVHLVYQVCGLCLASSALQKTRPLGTCTSPPLVASVHLDPTARAVHNKRATYGN
jgi:hypothetical protein